MAFKKQICVWCLHRFEATLSYSVPGVLWNFSDVCDSNWLAALGSNTNLLLNTNPATFLDSDYDTAPRNALQTSNHSATILTRCSRYLSSCNISLPINELSQISWKKANIPLKIWIYTCLFNFTRWFQQQQWTSQDGSSESVNTINFE